MPHLKLDAMKFSELSCSWLGDAVCVKVLCVRRLAVSMASAISSSSHAVLLAERRLHLSSWLSAGLQAQSSALNDAIAHLTAHNAQQPDSGPLDPRGPKRQALMRHMRSALAPRPAAPLEQQVKMITPHLCLPPWLAWHILSALTATSAHFLARLSSHRCLKPAYNSLQT